MLLYEGGTVVLQRLVTRRLRSSGVEANECKGSGYVGSAVMSAYPYRCTPQFPISVGCHTSTPEESGSLERSIKGLEHEILHGVHEGLQAKPTANRRHYRSFETHLETVVYHVLRLGHR